MRKRKTDKHLPERVYLKHNAYYYVGRDNKWLRLGRNLSEAMQRWSELIEEPSTLDTMDKLFTRYLIEIAPTKAKATYESNTVEIANLRKVFGFMRPDMIKTKHIYQYLDVRSKNAPTRANREKSLLSHIFTYAIKWGIVDTNPCRGVISNKEKGRDREVTDKEFLAVYHIAPPLIKAAMWLTYLTGLRQADLLKIKKSDLREDGIFVDIQKTRQKNRTRILITWTDALRETVNDCLNLHVNEHSEYLFCIRSGSPYTTSGFRSIWNRVLDKALGYCLFLSSVKLNEKNRSAIKNGTKVFIVKKQRQYFLCYRTKEKNYTEQALAPSELTKKFAALNDNNQQISLRDDELIDTLKNVLHSLGADMTPFSNKVLSQRFTFHDIRRKAATAKDSTEGREAARKLLGHSHQKMTAAYISGIQKVSPVQDNLDKFRDHPPE